MKLITNYATSTGLEIGDPDVKDAFYPLPFSSYITIQTGSGQAAKCYDYWQEVINLIKPVMDKRGLTIVHLGAQDDAPLQGVYDVRGKTSINQSHYLVKNAALHMGNDSWIAHAAGWNRRPLVALYGSTSVKNHGPYWYDEQKTVLLESHRNGGVPSYVANENPKTINLIPPEDVVNAVFKLLDLPDRISYNTRLIGMLYNMGMFEVIPNSHPGPTFAPGAPFTVRMDYHFDEAVLINLLQTGRKINLITNKPIRLDILQSFRGSILGYTHEIDEKCPDSYPAAIRALMPNHSFYTKEKDPKKLADLRFGFFDVCNINTWNELTKTDYVNAAREYLNLDKESPSLDLEAELKDNRLRFKTNKYILSNGLVFLSMAHLKQGKSITDLAKNSDVVIDDREFWMDLNNCYLYNE